MKRTRARIITRWQPIDKRPRPVGAIRIFCAIVAGCLIALAVWKFRHG